MVSLIDNILKSFVDKEFAQATFCDLSKAYNCVEHSLLLDKIAYYGVSESGLKLFESYLKTCRQLVCVGIDKSAVEFVNLGVPQGSFWALFSLCLMINDLSYSLNFSMLMTLRFLITILISKL